MRRLHRLAYVLVLATAVPAVFALPSVAAESARIGLVVDPATDGRLRVTAAVTDTAGKPLAGAAVMFRAKTAFGWLVLGEATTDRAGKAEVTISPAKYGEVSAETGDESPVSAAILIRDGTSPPPDRRPGRDELRDLSPQPGFISPYPVPQMAILALILGGIWIVYGYIITLLARIRRADRPDAAFRPR